MSSGATPDQGKDLLLKVLGLNLQGLDLLGGGSKGPCCHPVLKVLGRAVPELGTVGDLGRAFEFPQLGAEVVGRGDDQGLVNRSGFGRDSILSNDRVPTEPGTV